MRNVNLIQSKILELEGGAFQKLFDEYLYKRYRFKNIQTLGVQTGTNKPTKGIPDSYVLTDDGKYVLINYGSVKAQPAKKIKEDIVSCFNNAKLAIGSEKISKIICGHSSTNIHLEQFDDIINCVKGVIIELIGIDTLSHDLALVYPHIARDHLGIQIDTNQFFDIEDFVKAYDANGITAPISYDFLHREDDFSAVYNNVKGAPVTVLTGPSGIGKTRLALEVCRKFRAEGVKVYCIHSNGLLLYEDIKYYLDEPGNYLVFLDDANMIASLENTISTLLSLQQGYEIKILITVRDYAKVRVIHSVMKFSRIKTIDLKRFKNEEIQDILSKNLGIVNPEYLKRITEISNGNIRLAVLAGLRAIDDGYMAIRNAEDIFKNYYGKIIDDAKLSKDDLLLLFFIALAGPVKKGENKLYSVLIDEYGKEIREDEKIEKLYSLELIDWFKNEITKISDQSLGNYVFFYVLFEKKWIHIKRLIAISFPQYKHKVVYALSTIVEIFHSEKLGQYVKMEIQDAWDNAPVEHESEYLEAFYHINPIKALTVIKKRIEREPTVTFDLQRFDIDKKKSYHRVETKEIEILSEYKYTDCYEDAIDLMLLYYQKRPDLVMDFYFAITEGLFDKYSGGTNYKQESFLMNKLWDATKEGTNYNYTILYLHIAKYALQTEFTYTEAIRNSRSVSFVRMTINYSKEIADFRNAIWMCLGVLRGIGLYCDVVNDILSEVHFNGLDVRNSQLFLQSDFDAIFGIATNIPIDFYSAQIVNKYREVAEQIDAPFDERFAKADDNPEFRVYKLLLKEHLLELSFEEAEKKRLETIKAEVDSYSVSDYQVFFIRCASIEKKVRGRNQWQLSSGLDLVFRTLENDVAKYIQVLSAYLCANSPFNLSGYRQIRFLLNHIGYSETCRFISQGCYQNQTKWKALVWACLEPGLVTTEVANDYKRFLIENADEMENILPSVNILGSYGEKDEEITQLVKEMLVKNKLLSSHFMDRIVRDEDIAQLIKVFQNDMDALSVIYMNAIILSNHLDYEGKIFKMIFETRPQIWSEYVNWVKTDTRQDRTEQRAVEIIWQCDNWKKHVTYAFNALIADNMYMLLERMARLIFPRINNSVVAEREKKWLLEELSLSVFDIHRCRLLVDVVVTIMPEWKIDYLLEFLHVNKNVDDFKKLHLFPMSTSWSGSEVPHIINKINYLKELKSRIKGVDYLEHRQYIDDYCYQIEKFKEDVELREYMENADYA